MSTETTIRRVTWIGLAANLALAGFKFAAGYWGNSRALLADAVHSLTDIVTDAAVIAGSHFWGRPPDDCHPYGHRRVETLVAVFIGLMLAAAGVRIGWEALASLKADGVAMPRPVAAAAALVSVITKEALYRWTSAVGRRLKSAALAANAWHHRTDAISSLPVLAAVAAAIANPGWSFLDRVGALVVCLFILQAAWRIIWLALRELTDSGVPEAVRETIGRIVGEHPGVQQVHDIRTRYISANIQVDLHIVVNGHISVREGHAIAKAVRYRLMREMPEVIDAVVHVDPPEDAK